MRRIECHPAGARCVELDPRVALRRLLRRALDVEIAAHVATGNPAQPQERQHEVGEVLAHTGPDLQEIVGRRVVARHVLSVLEVPVDVLAECENLLAQRRAIAAAGRPIGGPQRRRVSHRTAEIEEVAPQLAVAIGAAAAAFN